MESSNPAGKNASGPTGLLAAENEGIQLDQYLGCISQLGAVHNLQCLIKDCEDRCFTGSWRKHGRGNRQPNRLVLKGAIMKKQAAWCVVLCVLLLAHCGGYTPTDVLVIGNSITHHGPKPSAGWYGDWGMAAPSAEKDFSHLVASALNVPLSANNLAIEDPQPNTLSQISAIATRVGPGTAVILEFGDNVRSAGVDAFEQQYGQLAAAVVKGNSLVCVSTWWESQNVDNAIKRACSAHGGRYAYIGDIRPNPANPDLQSTAYPDWQVNAHPQQWGHRQIAKRVLLQLRGR